MVAWPYKRIRHLLASFGLTYMHTKKSVRLPQMQEAFVVLQGAFVVLLCMT